MYHRITDHFKGVPRPTYNVTPKRFREQLQGLMSRGFRPWPLRKIIDYKHRGLTIPPKTFVVTFDDGYENNYHNAYPILKELHVPATIFLATAFLESDFPFPFDDWPAKGTDRVSVSSWRPLRLAQCFEMIADGLVDFGAHTHTHGDFRGRPRALKKDLLVCLETLNDQLGLASVPFAFPYGTRSLGYAGPILAAAAKSTGVSCALTTEPELISRKSDSFDWGRFEVTNADSVATLSAFLEGSYEIAREIKKRISFLKF